jgi:exopolysaccharide biosynthesis protein
MTARALPLSIVLVVALGCFAAVAGFTLRPLVDRTYLLWSAQRATGLAIEADVVSRIDGGYVIEGLRAHTKGGAASVAAPRVAIYVNGSSADVVLDAPAFVFDPDRYRGDEIGAFYDALAKFGSDATFQVRVHDGTLAIVTGGVPEPELTFDGVNGSYDERNDPALYQVAANLIDGERRYPFTGQTVVGNDGSIGSHWVAPFVPLAPLLPFATAGGDVRLQGGELTDLDVTGGPVVHASAQLQDGDVALGTHVLSGLHGRIDVAGNGLGSRDIVGMLDAVPYDASGEVHDLGAGFGWLRDGSNDLRELARLSESIAGEPQLRSAHVEATAPGLAFGQYAMASPHGPLAVSILSADPNEPTLRFDTAIAEDHVISGGERTSAMGLRTGAVAGVNGDYFDIGRTYQPQGMLVRNGELIRGPVDRAALAIDRDKHVTFAEFHLEGAVHAEGRTFPITQVNDWPAGYVTLITPAFGKTLPAEAGTTFASLEPLGDGKHYRVDQVQRVDAPLPVSFGIAFGPKAGASLHPGETVELSYRTDPPIDGAVAAIGGGPILVRNGAWYEDPHAPAPDERDYRWPVIALAQLGNGRLLLVAVDGRHPERSVGMMRPEFGQLLLRLGATDAMALDSGGSVTLVSRAVGDQNVTVRNVPSDNSAERWVSDALFLYSSAPPPSIVTPASDSTPVPEVRPSP